MVFDGDLWGAHFTADQINSDLFGVTDGLTPEDIEALGYGKIHDFYSDESSWRRHPLRRLGVERQHRQVELGDWLLKTAPFLRGPAEWAAERLDRLERWWR
jgi:hypothetical protein